MRASAVLLNPVVTLWTFPRVHRRPHTCLGKLPHARPLQRALAPNMRKLYTHRVSQWPHHRATTDQTVKEAEVLTT